MVSLSPLELTAGARDVAPKRRQIIEGAAAIFNECGYDGASMARIAEQAGVSKGTLYNYFVSKSDLFTAFVETETSTHREWILGTGSAELAEEDVRAALEGIARRLVQTLLSPAAQTLHRIIISEAAKFPHLARIYYDAGPRRGMREIAAWLRERVLRGQLEIDDPELAADQFSSLCRSRIWMLRCFNIASAIPDPEIDRVVAAGVTMFLNTYAPKDRP